MRFSRFVNFSFTSFEISLFEEPNKFLISLTYLWTSSTILFVSFSILSKLDFLFWRISRISCTEDFNSSSSILIPLLRYSEIVTSFVSTSVTFSDKTSCFSSMVWVKLSETVSIFFWMEFSKLETSILSSLNMISSCNFLTSPKSDANFSVWFKILWIKSLSSSMNFENSSAVTTFEIVFCNSESCTMIESLCISWVFIKSVFNSSIIW